MKNDSTQFKRPESTLVEETIYRYFPFWPLFVILALVFLLIGTFYLKKAQPVYEATATILLSDQLKGSDQNQVPEALSLPTNKNIVENELEVLHSRTLMEEVVNDLKLYAPVFRKGNLTDSVPAYSECPIVIEAQQPELLKEVRKIKFSVDPAKNEVIINNVSYPFNQFVNTSYGIFKFNYIPTRLGTARDYIFSIFPVKLVSAKYLKALEVTASIKTSTIVRLRITDEDPKKAEDILNDLLTKYTQSSINYKNQLAKNTMAFIDDRLNILSNNLKNVEQKVQQYKASNNITNLDDQGKLYLQNVTANDQRLTDINIQLAALNQVQQYVNSKDNAQIIAPSSLGVNDPVLTKLLDRLGEQQMLYEKLKRTTGANNPMLQSVQKQIDDLRPSIAENIQNQRKALEIGRSNIFKTNSGYNSILQSMPQKEKGLIEVTRDQSVKNATYSFLLQKREQAALAYSSTVPDSRIIDQAQSSPTPVSPKRSVVYIIAIALAALFSFAYILFSEIFNNKILFRNQIEESTAIPVLGEIKKYGKELNIADRSLLNKQLSKILTAGNMIGGKDSAKKIIVTSDSKNEGKTFVAENIAMLLAKSGSKTLLIDADPENKTLSLANSKGTHAGLYNVSISDDSGFQQNIIQLSDPNLFFLPVGNGSENSPFFLANSKFIELINKITSNFDFIIFDCSSIDENSAANILSPLADQTLFIIRHGITPKSVLQKLNFDPNLSNLNNIGIIFNGINKRGFILGTSRYGYGYEKMN